MTSVIRSRASAFVLPATLLAACAADPLTRTTDLGSGVHEVTVRSAWFPRRSVDLKVDADRAALAYCKSGGRALSVLGERLIDPDPPAYSTATVQFRCVPI